MTLEDFISIKDAAERLQVHRDRVWRKIKKLNIQEYTGPNGRFRYIRQDDFQRLVDAFSGYHPVTESRTPQHTGNNHLAKELAHT